MIKTLYKSSEKYIILFLLFNLIFLFSMLSIKYALPFVLSIFFAIWLGPIVMKVSEKTKIPKFLVNITIVLLTIIFAAVIFIFITLGIFSEIKNGISSITSIATANDYSAELEQINLFLKDISPELIKSIYSSFQEMFSTITQTLTHITGFIIKIAATIPGLVIGLIFTVMSTYFMIQDYNKAEGFIQNVNLGKHNDLIKRILHRIYSLIINYIKSYGILLSITFIECFALFLITKNKYSFTLAFICVLLDILPIVGTAMIFIPLAFYYILSGNYFYTILLVVSYTIIIVVRNIIEPKLLSKTMNIHPLLILISLFVGIKIGGIVGIIYIIFGIAFIKILFECNILTINVNSEKISEKE